MIPPKFTKAVIYFVKYPQPGKVKTRLAQTIGNEQAAQVYRKLAEKNFKILLSLSGARIDPIVFFDPADREGEIKSWLGAPLYFAQQGNDLGERMRHAFDVAFQQKGYDQVVILGSDILELTKEILLESFQALEHKDVVLGPAKDGGYYLIGMTSPHPELFYGIPWSTGVVLEKTLEAAAKKNLSSEVLAELDDLDELIDGAFYKINEI